ncbi:hypothetical protein [Caudoviricetes sp.]|nr:hypothetical protein [Caudoviricetes sp.]
MKLVADNAGKQTLFHSIDGSNVLEVRQDVSQIIEQNKAQYNAIDERAKWGELTKIASLPMVVIDDLNKKGIMRGFAVMDQRGFKAFLNDPDNRFFRTRPGEV